MNINRFILCLFVLCIVNSSFAQSPRKHISFDDNWKFHLGHAANPEKDFNYSINTIFSKTGAAFRTAIEPGFKDSTWRT
jgi:beta-galactosidase